MKKRLSISFLCLAILFGGSNSLAQIDSASGSQLFNAVMPLLDDMYDPSSSMVKVPHPGSDRAIQARESAYYAYGLLLRDGPGDRNKAEACLNAVLALQYTDPSKKWYGTFKVLSTETTPPGTGTGVGYDANWREFVGITFEMILLDFSDKISSPTRNKLSQAIDIAVAGEQKDGRLETNYTNPSLMFGALADFSAAQRHDATDAAKANAWMNKLYAGFKKHGAFWEFNSPTYYGVDILAITLWREHGSSQQMRNMGADMESAIWTQIANYYSPDMRNTAGPYDRSYYMDMTNYVSGLALWLSTQLPAGNAPLPAIGPNTPQFQDALAIPLIVALKPNIPAQALAQLRGPVQPHMVKQQIDDRRLATSWVGKDVLFGAEVVDPPINIDARPQYRPITVHWKTPTGAVGWMYVLHGQVNTATASPAGITALMQGDIIFVVSAPGASASNFTGQAWKLPGLNLQVDTDGRFSEAHAMGTTFQVTYNNMHRLTLTKR